MILDRILEQSGLEKGKEYFTQYTDHSEDGTILRPDVIIRFRRKSISSSIRSVACSLWSFCNSTDDSEKERWQKAHLDSVREHIKGLSEKNYSEAVTLDSPDFVLLFMPLESAFSLAIQNDPELFNFAWQRRIVMSARLHCWPHWKLSNRSGSTRNRRRTLWKLHGRVGACTISLWVLSKTWKKVGGQINALQNTYQEAHKKLTSGKGNLIRQTEMLKRLGSKAQKSISDKYLLENEEQKADLLLKIAFFLLLLQVVRQLRKSVCIILFRSTAWKAVFWPQQLCISYFWYYFDLVCGSAV